MNDDRERIRKAIDSIEPEEGARERMLAGIKSKAKAEEQRRRMVRSRSLRWLAAAACFCLVVLGAFRFSGVLGGNNVTPPDGTVEQSDPPVMDGSPYEDVANADELYEKTGVRIDVPARAEAVGYSVYDKSIAHVRFTRDGVTYTVMAAAKSGDFSGVDGETLSSEMIDAKTSAVMTKVNVVFSGEKWKVAWTDGRVSYYLTCPADADAEAVKKAALDVIALSGAQN